jgi:putative membrane protein
VGGPAFREDTGAWQDARVVQFLIKVVVNAVAIWVATVLIDGVEVGGDSNADKIVTLLVVGLIFGVVNAVIKPIVTFLAIPFYILTLGLISFVVNAAMLELVAWLSDSLGIDFTIEEFFWDAILAAVVVWLVSMALNLVLPEED